MKNAEIVRVRECNRVKDNVINEGYPYIGEWGRREWEGEAHQSVAIGDKSRDPSLLLLLNCIADRIKKLFLLELVEGVLK